MDDINFRAVFESSPGLYLILFADFKIAAVTDAYLAATMTKREEIIGQGLFDVFPDNPNDPSATGAFNLQASLNYVLEHKLAHKMAPQKYDIRRPDGQYEERFWSPYNKPVLDAENKIIYIIHNVVDVTDQIKAETELRKVNLTLKQKEVERVTQLEKSQQLFSYLFNYNPGAIAISKLSDFTFINVNESFLAMFGFFAKDEVIGKTAEELNIVYERQVRDEVLRGLSEKTKVVNLEGKVQTPNGEIKWITASFHMVEIDQHPCLFAAIIDITERKKIEDNLRQSLKETEDYKYALDESSIVAIVDPQGIIKYANDNFCKISKYSKEELLGKNHRIITWSTKYHSEEYIRNIWRVIESGKVWRGDLKNGAKDGTHYWVDTTIVPFTGGEGKPYQYVVIRTDITKRKEQEELLIIQAANLNQANKELETFSYSVSHDLKAPLRALEGYSKILLDDYKGKFDKDADRWLKFIADNANKMGVLINDILNFSKVSRSNIDKSRVDMKSLAEEVFNNEKDKYADKIINFELENLPDAAGDVAMLRLVWQNLISNALKYASKNEKIVIVIKAEANNNFNAYSIKDNGVGFDEKYKDKLFGVFQRLHSATEFEGTGVGLAIVNRIIQKHNGWITAHSELGKGAEFIFALPIIKTTI